MKKSNILVMDYFNADALTSRYFINKEGHRIACERVLSEFYLKHFCYSAPDDKVTIELMAAEAGRRFGADCVVIGRTEETTSMWNKLTFYAFSDMEEHERAKIKAESIERKIKSDLRYVKVMRKLSLTSFAIGALYCPASKWIYSHIDEHNLSDIFIYLHWHMSAPILSFFFGGMLLNYLKNSRIRPRLKLATTKFAPGSREHILMKNGIDYR